MIALKLRATSPPRTVSLNDSSCAPAHNALLPLERSPPASFKRMLGCRSPCGLRASENDANGEGLFPSWQLG